MVYTITPEIASDVNEFVFDIDITLPQEKSGSLVTANNWLHKQGHKASFESRSFLRSYFTHSNAILKKQNNIIHIRFTSEFIR